MIHSIIIQCRSLLTNFSQKNTFSLEGFSSTFTTQGAQNLARRRSALADELYSQRRKKVIAFLTDKSTCFEQSSLYIHAAEHFWRTCTYMAKRASPEMKAKYQNDLAWIESLLDPPDPGPPGRPQMTARKLPRGLNISKNR